MKKIFQDAKDKYVTALIVFGKAADSKLYEDAEYTKQVDQADVEDAFEKGVLMVVVGTAEYRPVKVAGNKVTIVDISSGSVTASEFQAKATA